MEFLSPGGYERLEGKPDWGLGQIQSVVGSRVTVNFEHAGKQLINTERAILVTAGESGSVL